jgi:hypothetical protein
MCETTPCCHLLQLTAAPPSPIFELLPIDQRVLCDYHGSISGVGGRRDAGCGSGWGEHLRTTGPGPHTTLDLTHVPHIRLYNLVAWTIKNLNGNKSHNNVDWVSQVSRRPSCRILPNEIVKSSPYFSITNLDHNLIRNPLH